MPKPRQKNIFVDYTGVYELHQRPENYGLKVPDEWGNLSPGFDDAKYPNPEIYAELLRWKEAGASVTLLAGGSDIATSEWWPESASPERVFDDVRYGNKSYPDTFKRCGGANDHNVLVDDDMYNLAVAADCGWSTVYYNLALRRRRLDGQLGESFAKVCFQNTVAT